MRIHLTGELLLEAEGGVLRAPDLPGRQGRLAFARLAISAYPLSRVELAELVWPGQLPRSWERDISTLISKIKSALAGVGRPDAISSALGCYQLALEPDDHVDVLDALHEIEAAEVFLRRDENALCQAAAEVAVNLARRPFLPGEEGDWVDARRAEQRRVLVRGLDVLAEVLVRRSRLPDALRSASEVVELEPFRESGYVALMRVQLVAGDRAEALRTYERARVLLAEELGISPSRVLQAAYEEALHADDEHATAATPAPSRRLAVGLPTGTVSLLFTDLVGSTELLDSMSLEQSEELRRSHFRLLRDAVATRRGHEVKTVGDGLMIAFAGASDAVACAVDIQQALERRNRDAPVPLAMRVGIHVGEPVLEAGDYFGLPPTLASRLCTAAAAGEILVSSTVRILAGADGATFIDERPLELKGIAEPVLACTVRWDPRDETPVPLPLPAHVDDASGFAFVGREQELASLERLVAHGAVALVPGEPGAGKTRLLGELAARVHGDGTSVLWGRCIADAGAPYRAFAEVLAHLATAADDVDLRSWVGARASELSRLVPALGERLGGVAPAPEVDGDSDRARLFAAIRSLLTEMAAIRPVLLVIDDAHWIDTASALLLKELATDPITRVTLVVAYRPTELDRVHPLADLLGELRRYDSIQRVAPRPLDEDDIVGLLGGDREVMHPERLALAVELVRLTEGNPFFVREVITHLEEIGTLDRRAERWNLDGGLRGLGIPEGVREVVGRRLARFDDACNQVLRTGAVIGRELELDVLAAVVDRDADELLNVLDPVLASGLLVEVPKTVDRFAFSHALVQETLSAELPVSRRVRLHRRIAETIEELRATRLDAHVDELAHHYTEAVPTGTAALAVRYLRASAAAARRAFADEAAAERLTRALDLANEADLAPRERAELLVEQAEVLRRLGDPAQKGAALAAAAVARELGDGELLGRAALAALEGWVLLAMSSPVPDPDVIGLLDEAIEAIGTTPLGIRLRAFRMISLSVTEPTQWSTAAGRALVEDARRSGDEEALLAALTVNLPDDLSNRDAHDRAHEEVRSLARRCGTPEWELAADFAAVCIAMVHGDVPAALDAKARVAASIDTLHLRSYRTWVRQFEAGFCLLAGRFDAAEEHLRSVADGLTGKERRMAFSQAGITYFMLARDRGALEPMLDAVASQVGRLGSRDMGFVASYVVALMETERSDDAARIYKELMAGPPAPIASYFQPPAWFLHTLAAHRMGDAQSAQSLYADGEAFADLYIVVGPMTACLGSARYGLALAATLLERWDEAEEQFVEARRRNDALGSPQWVAYVEQDHADMLIRRGRQTDRERAVDLATHALATAEELGMARLASDAQATLLAADVPRRASSK